MIQEEEAIDLKELDTSQENERIEDISPKENHEDIPEQDHDQEGVNTLEENDVFVQVKMMTWKGEHSKALQMMKDIIRNNQLKNKEEYTQTVFACARILFTCQHYEQSLGCLMDIYETLPSPFNCLDGIYLIARIYELLGKKHEVKDWWMRLYGEKEWIEKLKSPDEWERRGDYWCKYQEWSFAVDAYQQSKQLGTGINVPFHLKYLDTLLRTGQARDMQEAQQFAHVAIQFHRMDPLIRVFYKKQFPVKYGALFQVDDDAATTIACCFRRWQREKQRFVKILIDKYDLTHPFDCPIPERPASPTTTLASSPKSPVNRKKGSPSMNNRPTTKQISVKTNQREVNTAAPTIFKRTNEESTKYPARQIRSSSPKARNNRLNSPKGLTSSVAMETAPIETAAQEEVINYWELAHPKSPERLTEVELPSMLAKKEEKQEDLLESKRNNTLLDIYGEEATSVLDKRSPQKQSIVTPPTDQLDLKEVESFLRFAMYRSQVITQRYVPLHQLNESTAKPKWLQQLEALEDFVQTEQKQFQRRRSGDTSSSTKGSSTGSSYLTKILKRVISRLEKLSVTYAQLYGDTSDFLNTIQTLVQELDTWKCHDLPKSLLKLKNIGMKEEKARNLEFLHVFQQVEEGK